MDRLTWQWFEYLAAQNALILHKIDTLGVDDARLKSLTSEVNAKAAALKAAIDSQTKGTPDASPSD